MIDYEQKESPLEVYLSRLTTAGSKRAQLHELNSIAKFLSDGELTAETMEWHRLRFSHTLKARDWLAQNYKTSTANKALSALRGVLQSAWRLKMMSADDYFDAVSFQNVRGKTEPPGRFLKDDELAGMLRACRTENTNQGKRDYALLAVMYATGARRGEIAPMKVGDYHADELCIVILNGKSRKQRRVYVAPTIADAINARLEIYQPKVDDPLFCRIRRFDHITSEPMSDQALYNILQARAGQAGVKDVTPHDMRRTFISSLIDKGVDIVTVSRLAGHEKITDTARYDRRKEGAAQRAAALLTIPE